MADTQMFSYDDNIYSYNNNMFRNDSKISSSIDGMLLWLEPSKKNIVLDSQNKVIKWKDISGKLNHAYSDLRATYQPNTLNGYPTLLFNNNVYNVDLFINHFTIFTVFTSSDKDYIYEFGDDTDLETGFFLNGDDKSIGVSKDGTSNLSSFKEYQNSWGVGPWRLITHYYNGTNDYHRFNINGEILPLGPYYGYDDDPGNIGETKTLHIGARLNAANGMNGSIAEYIVYNRLLSDSEMDIVQNYLNNKYAIY